MKKIKFFKKIKLYLYYRKLVKKNKELLTNREYNLRIDRVNRLYTVINLSGDVKTYGPSLAEKYIKEYINKVDKIFIKIGLSEYIGIIDIEMLDEQNYLIVFGFEYFDTAKMANNLISTGVVAVLLYILYTIFF